ncbi:MAG TPA: ABC transporter ATP-binding protein [bacterium]|nr:ABC transporter ATP-binding protein [bacterium]
MMYRFFISPYLSSYLAFVFWATVYALSSVVSVAIVMPFVNLVFSPHTPLTPLISFPVMDRTTALWILCGTTFAVFLIKNFAYIAFQSIGARLQQKLITALREFRIHELLRMSYGAFLAENHGAMHHRLITTSETTVRAWMQWIFSLCQHFPLLVLYSAVLFILSWKITLLSLVLIPGITLLQHRLQKYTARWALFLHERESEIQSDVWHKLQAFKLIRLFHSAGYEAKRFSSLESRRSDAATRRDRLQAIVLATVEMAGVSVGGMLLLTIGSWTMEGEFMYGPGGFVLFIAAAFSIIDPARHIARGRMFLSEARTLWDEYKNKPMASSEETSPTKDIASFTNALCLEETCFAHRTTEILNKVNITIRRGECVIITGKTGAGKSTILDLIIGLYAPQRGCITLDGIPVTQISHATRAKLFGLMTQEPLIMHATVRDNVVYDQIHVSDEHVIEALTHVQLDTWIKTLPDGLDTIIGEKGWTMSGGERQRLALARIVLRKPEILLLDEATSALDETTEKALLETMARLFSDKTRIIVSHRPAARRWADRMFELDEGQLIEISKKTI